MVALAVTHVLAKEANQFLQAAVPRDVWADLVIEDLKDEYPSALKAPDAKRPASSSRDS